MASIALFVGILFAYELFDLWASPWWTAWLIVGYFLSGAGDRRGLQARYVLQICVSDRAV